MSRSFARCRRASSASGLGDPASSAARPNSGDLADEVGERDAVAISASSRQVAWKRVIRSRASSESRSPGRRSSRRACTAAGRGRRTGCGSSRPWRARRGRRGRGSRGGTPGRAGAGRGRGCRPGVDAQPGDDVEDLGPRPEAAERVDLDRHVLRHQGAVDRVEVAARARQHRVLRPRLAARGDPRGDLLGLVELVRGDERLDRASGAPSAGTSGFRSSSRGRSHASISAFARSRIRLPERKLVESVSKRAPGSRRRTRTCCGSSRRASRRFPGRRRRPRRPPSRRRRRA